MSQTNEVTVLFNEVCFGGWSGQTADKPPVYLGEGESGLTCPRCGPPDDLSRLLAEARRGLVEQAQEKS